MYGRSPMKPSPDDLARVRLAHRALLDHLDALAGTPAGDASLPSLLPGWTRGHVLTHIARNADSFVRVLNAAENGDVVAQYEGGAEGRNADIEAGAPRPWDDQLADVRAACDRLDEVFAGQQRWDLTMGHSSGVEVPHADLPFRRLREVVVHHADLGDDGYTPADWPQDYVREELRRMEMLFNARKPMGATGLPGAALRADPLQRLCWLLGRVEIDGLEPAGVF
jgi:maleylpyruvate isomerase